MNKAKEIQEYESGGSTIQSQPQPRVTFSGPPPSSSRYTESDDENDEDEYVEITIDLYDEKIVLLECKKKVVDEQESALITSNKVSAANKKIKKVLANNKRGFNKQVVDGYSSSRKARDLHVLQFVDQSVDFQGWVEVESRFDQLAVDGFLLPSAFAQCIGMKEKKFAEVLFDVLARRRRIVTTNITKFELHEFWAQLSDQCFDARLQIFFAMMDKDDNGRITKEEVKQMLTLCASINGLSNIQDNAEEYASIFMEELDPEGLGYFEFYHLEKLLLNAPTHLSNTGTDTDNRKLSELLSLKLVRSKEPNLVKRVAKRCSYFIEENWKRIWVILLWLGICAGLFTWKFIQYKNRYVFHVLGYCVTSAKGAAETLKFNMALILLPLCRNTLTWLRSRTKLGKVVPFDDDINFHKVVAGGVAIGVGIHVICHLTCDFPRLLHASREDYAPLGKYFGHNRPPNYWWFVKGVEGWTGIFMLVLMTIAFVLAQPWFRRNNANLPKALKKLTGFNAFWYSHHLFAVVYVLLVVHGYFLYLSKEWYKKTTWMYLVVPLVLYSCERLLGVLRSNYKTVQILKFAVYPGNVLTLQLSKPQGFKYISGQYIYVNCADVSPFEWHPFSLTSAPGDEYVSVHIKTFGDWTSQLRSLFSKICQPPTHNDQSGLLGADIGNRDCIPRMPKIKIDGPYGAPAQDYRNYDVLLLVGLGIGAAPLISIVKDVLYHIKQRQYDMDNEILELGLKSSRNNNKKKAFNVKKAYFYWVTREQGSFEWFRSVMNEVAESDNNHVIELHNYCTSVYEEGDARSALIAIFQYLHHAKNGVDIVSGTRVKTHFARPNWRDVFKHVAVNHTDQRVGVFYGGAQGLAKDLRHLSQDFSRKTSIKFDFHKENY